MLTQTEVEHIAKLARVALTPAEIEKFQKELGSILEYFAILSEADVVDAKVTTHSVAVENVTRKDIGIAREKSEGRDVLSLAPEKEDGYLKVKPILHNGKHS
jgi:aspartyl-tRNA(Asn)/glutamyl-tRNA(Gln) amidotransferase subunit C